MDVILIVCGFDFDAEGRRSQAGTNANPLGRQSDVGDDVRGLQMRTVFVDGHIELAEFQFADNSQGTLKRLTGETERGASNVHGTNPPAIYKGGGRITNVPR